MLPSRLYKAMPRKCTGHEEPCVTIQPGVLPGQSEPTRNLPVRAEEKRRSAGLYQAMDRITPPSARTADPLTAEANGLHTKATTAATSSGVANRCRIEL